MEVSAIPAKYKRGEHPNSKKNLKPFPKGHCGNPRVGYSLTMALKDSLNKPLKKPSKDASVREHIIYSTLEGALEREPTPFNTVWDRVEGRLQDVSPEPREIINSFIFVLPNGTRLPVQELVKLKELNEG